MFSYMSGQDSDDEEDIPETHNYTKTVGTRLSPKTKDRLDDYTDAQQVSKAEGVRRLIRAGLDAESGDDWRDRTGRAFALLLLAGYPTAAAATGDTTIAAGWIIVAVVATLFEPWITAAITKLLNPLDLF